MKKLLKKIYRKFKPLKPITEEQKIAEFLAGNRIPWSNGYNEYKWKLIEDSINDKELLNNFKDGIMPVGFGKGVDERAVEYPWLFSHIPIGKGKFLDAGSTFNFNQILSNTILKDKEISIYTFYPESENFIQKRISYIYGDLRELPFRQDYFDQVVCHSTLEHIDMDNSMYGYELSHIENVENKSYDYLKVILELERVVKPGGNIYLTFPYGKFENHGFFQQFDVEMVQRLEDTLTPTCSVVKSFVKYEQNGWRFASQNDCNDALSYNPHTGRGKGTDNAAHSRSICFIEIKKNN